MHVGIEIMKKLSLVPIVASIMLSGCVNSSGPIYWSKKADKDIRYAIGSYIKELPIFRGGPVKESKTGIDGGIKYATVYTLSEYDRRTSNTMYRTEMMRNDFTIQTLETGLYRGVKSVSLEYILVVTYGGYQDNHGNDIFAVETFLYKDKQENWPTREIKSVVKEDIPHIEAPYYYIETGSSYGMDFFQLYCFGLTSNSENEYYQILKNAGYITRTNSSACNAVKHSSKINLDFYYDVEQEVLFIQGYLLEDEMVWPENEIKAKFGMDLPIYSDPAVTYRSGNYVLENGNTYYVVECEYAPSSSLNAYTTQLITDGWEKEPEDKDLPEDWPIFMSANFARFTKGKHLIEVRYYDPSDPILGQLYEYLYYPILMIIIYS